MQNYSTAKAEYICGIVKKLWSGSFPILKFPFFFLNLGKMYTTDFFLIFPVSSSVCNKKIFIKNKGSPA